MAKFTLLSFAPSKQTPVSMGLAACGPKIKFERDVEEKNICPCQKPKPLVRLAAYSF